MRARAFLPGILSAMCVLVAGVFWVKLDAERGRSAHLSARLDAVTSQLHSLKSLHVSVSPSAAEPSPASADGPVASEQSVPYAAATSPGYWRQVAESHHVSDAQYAYIRLQLPQNYPGLQSELGLSPDQMGQLFDVLIKHQKEFGSLSESLDGSSEQERVRSFADVKQQQKVELSALLGARYLQYDEYMKTQPERVQVAGLGRVLESTGEPLRDDQVQRLTRAFIEARQRVEAETVEYQTVAQSSGVRSETISDLRASANQRILSDAGAYLSDRQQQALRLQLETQLEFSDNGAPPPVSFPLLGTP